MQQTIETKIAQAWTAAWNEGNYDPLRDLLAPEFVRESKGSERTVDAEGFIKQIHEVRQALPDSTTKIERVLARGDRSEEHTSELQSRGHLVCRLLLEK